MPVYEYKGINQGGKNTKGTLQADNLKSAKLKLKKDGIYIHQIKNKSTAKARKTPSYLKKSL